MRVLALAFDLDDTLYPHAVFLSGAWAAVAAAAVDFGVDALELERSLGAVAAEGSDRGRIIDRALSAMGRPEVPVAPLVDAFRSHSPAHLPLYDHAAQALASICGRVPLACITDGDPRIQRAKLAALGLDGVFDTVVISDELGRQHRKPHPLPFRVALEALGTSSEKAVHIGDRPDKDTAGAARVGMRSVRVLTGEYHRVPDLVGPGAPWLRCADVTRAIGALEDWL